MFKSLTVSLCLLSNSHENLYSQPTFQIESPLVLVTPRSPTLHQDPWENYRNKLDQEISNKILEMEINEWEK